MYLHLKTESPWGGNKTIHRRAVIQFNGTKLQRIRKALDWQNGDYVNIIQPDEKEHAPKIAKTCQSSSMMRTNPKQMEVQESSYAKCTCIN